jgi:hypothetical protein
MRRLGCEFFKIHESLKMLGEVSMCGGDNTKGNFQNLQEKDQNSCNIELELIW